MAAYEKFHICDQVIEDESSGRGGLDVSVHVDTLKKCTIHLGKSMTIRTDEQGLDALRHILHDASRKIVVIRAAEKEMATSRAAERRALKLSSPGSSKGDGPAAQPKERSETQKHDVFDDAWNPSDPTNW